MAANVTLPDGFTLDEGPAPSAVAPAVAPLPDGFALDQSSPSVAADVAKSGGIGVAKGAIGLAGLPGDVQSILGQYNPFDWAARKFEANFPDIAAANRAHADRLGRISDIGETKLPTSQGIQSQVERATGKFYEPQTTAGQYAQTVGEFLPAAVAGPGGLARRAVTQAVVPALASETAGQVFKGTDAEPVARIAGAVVGGGLGAAVPVAARRAITPFPISADRQAALGTLQAEGVQVPASMATGSRALKAAESELGGGQYSANVERMNDQYTQAALRRAGIAGERAAPDVLNAASDRIGNTFDTVAARNPSIPLGNFRRDAEAVANDFRNSTGQDSPLLRDFIDRIAGSTSSPSLNMGASMGAGARVMSPGSAGRSTIAGDAYQSIQSDIQRHARGTSTPELRHALYDLKGALDDAIQRGIRNPTDAAEWGQARRQWANLMTIDRAVTGSTEAAANGMVTPAKLTQAIEAMKRGSYVRGRGDFADLARAGNQIMKPFQDSGTAARVAAKGIPALVGGILGGGLNPVGVAAAAVSPWIAGRALMSGPVQRYLVNQRLAAGPAGRGGLPALAAPFLPAALAADRQLLQGPR